MRNLYVRPDYPWYAGTNPVNLGEGGPRLNPESAAYAPRWWPTVHQIPLRGMGAMPTFVLGPTLPVFNNQIAGGAPGRNILMPGIARQPFGG